MTLWKCTSRYGSYFSLRRYAVSRQTQQNVQPPSRTYFAKMSRRGWRA